jgi:DNA-binding IclR family transcriptional regulator
MTVRTADRTLDIFESFAKRQKPTTVSDLARELSLPMSTCFSLVRTLVDRGFLYYLHPRGAFYPTRRLIHVAEAIAQHDPISQRVVAFLEELRDRTGETVVFGKLQGIGVVYLEIVESRFPIRYTMNIGVVRDLHATSIGKAILSAMSNEQRERVISKIKYGRLTKRTLQNRSQLERNLEEGRRRGYWTNVGESAADVSGIAQPVGILGDLYGIALIGPDFRFDRNMKEYAEALASTVKKVARACEGIAP